MMYKKVKEKMRDLPAKVKEKEINIQNNPLLYTPQVGRLFPTKSLNVATHFPPQMVSNLSLMP